MRKDLLINLVSGTMDLFFDNLLGIETQCLLFFSTLLQRSSKPNLLVSTSPLAEAERKLLSWVDLKPLV